MSNFECMALFESETEVFSTDCVWDDKKKYSLVDLLPQSNNALINRKDLKKRILVLIEFFCFEMIETVKFFFSAQYDEFDSHVGESLCQIRAFMIYDLANKFGSRNKKTIDFILSNLEKIRYNARQLIAAVDSNRDARERNLSLQDYLKDNGLDFFFSKCFFSWL